jgi:hypothetical protein
MPKPNELPLPPSVRRYFSEIRRRARSMMDRADVDDDMYIVAADCLELAEEAEVQMATIIVLTRMICRLRNEGDGHDR